MILFFFMVTTTMRGEEVLVRTRLPEAGAAANLKRDTPVVPVHIGSPDEEQAGDPRILDLIAQRAAAKKERNFAEADRIRDMLASEGIILVDTPQGTTYKKA